MAEAQNQVKVQQAQESLQNGEEPGPKQPPENAHQLKLSQDKQDRSRSQDSMNSNQNSKGSGDINDQSINEKRVLK